MEYLRNNTETDRRALQQEALLLTEPSGQNLQPLSIAFHKMHLCSLCCIGKFCKKELPTKEDSIGTQALAVIEETQ